MCAPEDTENLKHSRIKDEKSVEGIIFSGDLSILKERKMKNELEMRQELLALLAQSGGGAEIWFIFKILSRFRALSRRSERVRDCAK